MQCQTISISIDCLIFKILNVSFIDEHPVCTHREMYRSPYGGYIYIYNVNNERYVYNINYVIIVYSFRNNKIKWESCSYATRTRYNGFLSYYYYYYSNNSPARRQVLISLYFLV